MEFVRNKAELARAMNMTPDKLDRLFTMSRNPGKTAKGYGVAAWVAFADAESDPSNELKRARCELLWTQIQKMRGELVASDLFLKADEQREIEMLRVAEQFRQTELGRCRDKDEAAAIDARWDSFRTAVKDAIIENRENYVESVARSSDTELATAVEENDPAMGA